MSPWTHRLAVATACATFVLLLIGGVVHGTGSSLACPDWPLCFGSFFPEMKGSVAIEHGHRLFASGVGLLTLALLSSLIRDRRRVLSRGAGPGPDPGDDQAPRARRLLVMGVAATVLVCFQGVLGGLTVIYRLPTLISSAHLATSMIYFGLIVAIMTLASPRRAKAAGGGRARVPRSTYVLALATTALTYLQIALGGLVRHTGAGLACLDVPLCRGQVLPLDEHPTVFIQALHRLNAVLVAALIILLAVLVKRAASGPARTLALGLIGWVVLQITLGVMSVLSFLGLLWVTAHLGVAALILAGLVRLCLVMTPDPPLLEDPATGGGEEEDPLLREKAVVA